MSKLNKTFKAMTARGITRRRQARIDQLWKWHGEGILSVDHDMCRVTIDGQVFQDDDKFFMFPSETLFAQVALAVGAGQRNPQRPRSDPDLASVSLKLQKDIENSFLYGNYK